MRHQRPVQCDAVATSAAGAERHVLWGPLAPRIVPTHTRRSASLWRPQAGAPPDDLPELLYEDEDAPRRVGDGVG